MKTITVTAFNETEFRNLLTEVVTSVVRSELSKVQSVNEKPISQKELAKYLNVSERTIMRWRDKGDVPYLQIGHRILYQTSEVLKALTKIKANA